VDYPSQISKEPYGTICHHFHAAEYLISDAVKKILSHPKLNIYQCIYRWLLYTCCFMLTTIHNWFADDCVGKEGYKPCFSEGCFLATKKCDGFNDCEDWSDESECKCPLHQW